MQTRANQLHTSPTHWASRPGWGGGKNSTSNLPVLGGFAFWVLNLLASGLRELQSDGGNATRQNLGLGWINCTPTSATPACPGLLSAGAGDFFSRQNVTERQVPARADRLSQQEECAVGARHFGLGPFGKCGAFGLLAMHDDSRTKKDALAPPLAWGISGPRAGRAHNPPPSTESGMQGRSQMPAPDWSCCPAFGFTAVSGEWPVRRNPCRRVSAASSSL
jgi:hypothetical protein